MSRRNNILNFKPSPEASDLRTVTTNVHRILQDNFSLSIKTKELAEMIDFEIARSGWDKELYNMKVEHLRLYS